MRSTRGQATVDYVAIIAVLAILFALALASAAAGAPGVVNAVAGQIRHALCVVSGGPCPDVAPQPCTVATTRHATSLAVNLLLVRIDRDRYVLRELMSDGTVRLTVAHSGSAGVEIGVGFHAGVKVKGREVGADDEARAGVQGVIGGGRVFVARDAHEAAAFMRAIRDGRSPPVAPREVFFEGGLRGVGSIGIGTSVAGAWLEGLAGTMISARRDQRTGQVTLALNAGASGWGALDIVLGGPAGTDDRSSSIGLTIDRHHRPTEVTVSVAGTLGAGGSLPLGLSKALGATTSASLSGALSSGSTSGRKWELSARLDLRDPVAAAAWKTFRHDPASGDAIRALAEAIRDRANLDVRAYDTNSTSAGVAGGISDVVRVGGQYDRTTDRGRLIAASSRPSGGLWEERFDCVAS